MDLDCSEPRLPQGMFNIACGSKGEDVFGKSQAPHRIGRQEAERKHATCLEHPPELAGTCRQRSPEVHRVDAAYLVELTALKRQGLDFSDPEVGASGIDRNPISRSRPRHHIPRAIDRRQMSSAIQQGAERSAATEPDLGHAVGGLHIEQLQRKAVHPAVAPVHQAADKTAEDAARVSEMASDQARRSHYSSRTDFKTRDAGG
ncbi:hypothetical protein ACVISU_002432 [Bradyrhizobium sp. USDA 4452]